MMLRTHNCGELGIKDVKSNVTLCGWAQKIRDKGNLNKALNELNLDS